MATLVVWVLLDYFRTGHATAVGGATGDRGRAGRHHAGGRASSVPMRALLLGGIAAFPSYFVIVARSRTRLDDSLDVFAGHGVGGITGALLTGVFASKVWNAAGNDGLLAGNPAQLAHPGARRRRCDRLRGGRHVRDPQGARLRHRPPGGAPQPKGMGMDVTQHGEEAYTSGEGSILVIPEPTRGMAPAPVLNPQTAAR